MPRYYCDYCDTYLTHDSQSGRKQHNRGWKHRENVKLYYEQIVMGHLMVDALPGSWIRPMPGMIPGLPGRPPLQPPPMMGRGPPPPFMPPPMRPPGMDMTQPRGFPMRPPVVTGPPKRSIYGPQ